MVKLAKKGATIYVVFMLYFVFYSQARCSNTKLPARAAPISSVSSIRQVELPPNWAQEALTDNVYRDKLKKSNLALLKFPSEVVDSLNKAKRLNARNSVAPVDATLFTLTTFAENAHTQGNYEIRKTKMGAAGVPIPVYASNRGRSSSGYSSGHK